MCVCGDVLLVCCVGMVGRLFAIVFCNTAIMVLVFRVVTLTYVVL